MTKKTTVIIGVIVGVIVLIGVVALIALNVINSRAEEEITQGLEEALRSSGMQDVIGYQSVDVQAATGTVTVNGVSIAAPDQTMNVTAARVSLSVPPGEITAFVNDPNTATFSKVDIEAQEIDLAAPDEQMGFTATSAILQLSGALSQRLQSDPTTFLTDVDSIAFTTKELELQPSEMMIAQMQMQGATWIAEEENRRIDSMTVNADISPEEITLTEIAFDSPILKASGDGSLAINEMLQPVPRSMRYEVSEIHPELRQQFAMMGSMLGLVVPEEGGFTFNLTTDANGYPSFSIE